MCWLVGENCKEAIVVVFLLLWGCVADKFADARGSVPVLLYIGWGSVLRSCCGSLSLQNAFKRQAGQPRRRKEQNGELERKKPMSTSTHFKRFEFNLRRAGEFRDKTVATLQRTYHSVSWLVSWSDNSRQSQLGSLLHFDECFPTLPVSTLKWMVWIILLHFVQAIVKRFLNTL